MRKRWLLAFIALLMASNVLAIETTIRQEYKPGETLIVSIEGNFLENIKTEDIQFYSGRTFVSMIYDVAKIDDKFYIYAILPLTQRNYSLIIKNTKYVELGQEKSGNLEYNFSVRGNVTNFYAKPGFLITNKDFEIEIKAYKNINIKTIFLNETKETSIKAEETKKILFSISPIREPKTTILTLEGGNAKYEIPVSVFVEKNETKPLEEIGFSKTRMNVTVLKNSDFVFDIFLENIGNEDVENITLVADSGIKLGRENIARLRYSETEKINFTIKSEKEGIESKKIIARYGNKTTKILVSIITAKDINEYRNITLRQNATSNISGTNECSELQGKICLEDETCEGETRITIEGICCIGECKKPNSGSSKIWVIIIVVILLLVIGFFVYKKMKAKGEKPEDIIRKRGKDYEERFKPEEVRNKLTRV